MGVELARFHCDAPDAYPVPILPLRTCTAEDEQVLATRQVKKQSSYFRDCLGGKERESVCVVVVGTMRDPSPASTALFFFGLRGDGYSPYIHKPPRVRGAIEGAGLL